MEEYEKINDPIRISLPEKWEPITNSNRIIENGAYIVTLLGPYDRRKTEVATYFNGTWVVNNPDRNNGYKVIAYMLNPEDSIIPYEGSVQQFKVGDIIVWNNDKDTEKRIMCWMLIGSFDYPSDRAARAKVGKEYFSKDIQTIYTGWCPNNFGKNVRLATDDEVSKICDELLNYYKTNFKVSGRNVGRAMIALDLHELRPDLYDRITDMWDEEEINQ